MLTTLTLFALFASTSAIGSTGSTGATGAAVGCPPLGLSLDESSRDYLSLCSQDTLRRYYMANDCCIINIAGCNNIYKVLDGDVICPSDRVQLVPFTPRPRDSLLFRRIRSRRRRRLRRVKRPQHKV